MKAFASLIFILFGFLAQSQTLTVTSPQLGDTLIGGQTYTLTWTTTGSIPNVDIYYLRNGVLKSIQNSVSNTGTYTWTVPGNIQSSSNGYIRIKSSTSSYYDQNDFAFQFLAAPNSLTLLYPNALTDTIQSGSPNTITWSSTGTVSQVRILYSLNGGQTYAYASFGTSNTGAFTWTPQNYLNSNKLRIKVVDKYDQSTFDEGDTTSILKIGNTLSIIQPQPSNLIIGSNVNISWSATGTPIPLVDLSYSNNYGAWIPIASGIANTGSYNWTVPNDSSNNIRLQIKDAANPGISQILYGYSITAVPQTISLIAPNGGETFTEGDSVSLQWTNSNNLLGLGLQILMDYSLDSGLTWQNIADWSIDAGTFPWTIPLHKVSNTCLVKIHIIGLPGIADTSDGIFTINYGTPAIQITEPIGGERYGAERSGRVKYFTSGLVDSLDLFISTNSGSTWTLLQTGVSSQYFTYPLVWPDIQSSTVRVKLREKNGTLSDSSANDFTISKLFLTSPYPNSSHFKGSTSSITWNKTSTTGDTVALYYSVDSGSTWVLINDSIPNSGTYSWLVPNENSIHCRIKIVDKNNNSYRDSSAADFKIYPSVFEVTYPNGGEFLDPLTGYTLSWNTNGYSSRVNLDYSLDNGATWTSIGTYISNQGSYAWTSPNSMTSLARFRVSNYFDNTQFDLSDSTFNIGFQAPKSLTILSPNGGENFSPGSVAPISWTSTGAVDSVDLYYSSNNGITWNLIAAGELNDSSYSWTMPNTLSNDYLLRISEKSNNSVGDTSDATFQISNFLAMAYPNGGENFSIGNSYSISWIQSGTFGALDLSYSIDSGATWTLIGSNLSSPYSWQVPNQISNDVLMRISDGTTSDESDAVFSINPQPSNSQLVAKFYFDEGEVNDDLGNYPGDRHQVLLTNDRFGCKNHAISLTHNQGYINLGDSFDNLIAAPDTSFSISLWLTRLGGGNSGTIVSKNSDSNCGENGRQFSIAINSIGKIQFISQYSLGVGNYDITQTTGGVATSGWHHVVVNYDGSIQSSAQNRLEIYIDDVLQTLINSGSQGTLGDIQDGPACFGFGAQIKSDSTVCGNSFFEGTLDDINFYSGNLTPTEVNALFTETKTCPMASLNINSPTSFSIHSPGDQVNITWNTAGTVANVDLSYSIDGGYSFQTIATSLANTGNYLWTVPMVNSDDCLIRIVSSNDAQVFDETDNFFPIELKSLDIINPNLGQNLNGLASTFVRWNSEGSVQAVNIYLSIDSGATWTSFATNVNNNIGTTYSTYYYTVPNISAPHCLFAIVDTADINVTDTVDQLFSIQLTTSSLNIINPNGGEMLIAGNNETVLWTHQGSINQVNLSYSIDSGSTFISIATNETNDGNYSWTVPNVSSINCLLRIVDTAANGAMDTSNAVFSISPPHQLAVSHPNGSELIEAYAMDSITWTSGGMINMLDIYFSQNNGLNWQLVEDSVPNTGKYIWNTPAYNNQNCLIRIVETGDNSISDTSDTLFELGPIASLELLYPNGGEVFLGGTLDSVLWDGNGNLNVNNSAMFSSDSGQTWIWVGDDLIPKERLFWTLPNISSTNCLIAFAGDTSDAVFTINKDNISLLEQLKAEGPQLYPNPINRADQIQFTQASEIKAIEIIDNLGRLILSTNRIETIDLKTLDAGIYHVRINTNKESYLRKLVIR